jgi:uncharacterized glyoxalase superfamily protein PhnB
MKFADISFLTEDVGRLRAFYEAVFEEKSEGDEFHAWISAGGVALVFDSAPNLAATDAFSYAESMRPGAAVLSFDVSDADAQYARLKSLGIVTLNAPTTHPWGARSFQFADPDGNVLNFRTVPGAKTQG